MPICIFYLPRSYHYTQCPTVSTWLRTRLIRADKTNSLSISQLPRWSNGKSICACSIPKNGSTTQNMQQLIKDSNQAFPTWQRKPPSQFLVTNEPAIQHLQSLKPKECRTEPFKSDGDLFDAVFSDLAQFDSSFLSHTQKISTTIILTTMVSGKKTVAIPRTPIHLTPLKEHHSIVLEYKRDLHEVTCFFYTPTYCVWTSADIRWSTPLSISYLFNMGTGPYLARKEFLLLWWK